MNTKNGIAATYEPSPTPTSGRPVWEMVIEDMRQRDHVGREKYGTPLQAHNGRRPLVDAYQEVLDLAVYLRQEIEERAALEQYCEEMRGLCHALEQENRIMREDVKGIIEREFETMAAELAAARAEAENARKERDACCQPESKQPSHAARCVCHVSDSEYLAYPCGVAGCSAPGHTDEAGQLWLQVASAEGGCPAGERGAR